MDGPRHRAGVLCSFPGSYLTVCWSCPPWDTLLPVLITPYDVVVCCRAKTILWNGPMGVFEWPNFREFVAYTPVPSPTCSPMCYHAQRPVRVC